MSKLKRILIWLVTSAVFISLCILLVIFQCFNFPTMEIKNLVFNQEKSSLKGSKLNVAMEVDIDIINQNFFSTSISKISLDLGPKSNPSFAFISKSETGFTLKGNEQSTFNFKLTPSIDIIKKDLEAYQIPETCLNGQEMDVYVFVDLTVDAIVRSKIVSASKVYTITCPFKESIAAAIRSKTKAIFPP